MDQGQTEHRHSRRGSRSDRAPSSAEPVEKPVPVEPEDGLGKLLGEPSVPPAETTPSVKDRGGLSPEIGTYIEELRSAFRRVSEQIVGREDLLNQSLLTLLTREHQLVYSRAGMAKSLYARAIFSQFSDAPTFKIQLTKGTTEEALVGAINIEELKRGSIVHNVDGSIVRARLAFLDEIFDANDVALRSLLSVLNERMFEKGKQHVDSPLHSAIATSNYMRSNDVTEAVIDRFVFRAILLPDEDQYEMLRVDQAYEDNHGTSRAPTESEQMPFAHLSVLADIVDGVHPDIQIEAPHHVLFLKNAIALRFIELMNQSKKPDEREFYLSPRTIARARDVLNASALLHGRTTSSVEDLPALKYILTTLGDKRQEKLFEQALGETVQKISRADLRTVDRLMEADELVDAIVGRLERGESIKASILERIKLFFGLTSISELSFGRLRTTVEQARPEHPLVKEIQTSLLERLRASKARYEKKTTDTLY